MRARARRSRARAITHMMKSRNITLILAVAVAIAGAVFVSSYITNVRLSGNDAGYEPVQPIAYSHRLHAGELGLDCKFCHTGAEHSRTAGIPSASVCMDCHRVVTAPWVNVK